MNYYELDPVGQIKNDECFCYVTSRPEGVTGNYLVLEYGGPLDSVYPDNPLDVKMYLDPDYPDDIRRGDFISTSSRHVMVSSAVVAELKKHRIGRVNFCPFTLINHRGRVHSQDYSFVVPEQQFDGLNEAESEIERCSSGVVMGIDNIVLDKQKLLQAPDMFRLNDTWVMVFAEPLVEILLNNYTNFVFKPLEQR